MQTAVCIFQAKTDSSREIRAWDASNRPQGYRNTPKRTTRRTADFIRYAHGCHHLDICNLTNLRPAGPADKLVVTDSVVAPVETGGSETTEVQGAASVSDHCT